MQSLGFLNKNIQIKEEAHALWYSYLTKSLSWSSIGSVDQQKPIQQERLLATDKEQESESPTTFKWLSFRRGLIPF